MYKNIYMGIACTLGKIVIQDNYCGILFVSCFQPLYLSTVPFVALL